MNVKTALESGKKVVINEKKNQRFIFEKDESLLERLKKRTELFRDALSENEYKDLCFKHLKMLLESTYEAAMEESCDTAEQWLASDAKCCELIRAYAVNKNMSLSVIQKKCMEIIDAFPAVGDIDYKTMFCIDKPVYNSEMSIKFAKKVLEHTYKIAMEHCPDAWLALSTTVEKEARNKVFSQQTIKNLMNEVLVHINLCNNPVKITRVKSILRKK